MSAPHICLTCRQAINRVRLNKSFQRYSTFISLQNTPRKFNDNKRKSLADRSTVTEDRDIKNCSPALEEPGDALESLFEATLRKAPNQIRQKSPSIDAFDNFEILKSMIKDHQPINDCWSFFLDHFGPAAWKARKINRKSCPPSLGSEVHILVNAMMAAKVEQPFFKELPSYADMTLVLFELGFLHGNQWANMMFALLDNITKTGIETVKGQSLLSDLLKSWNVVCRLLTRDAVTKIDPSSLDWSHIPYIRHARKEKTTDGIHGAFGVLTPPFPRSETIQVPVVAVGTLKLLLDLDNSSLANSTAYNADPLLRALAGVIYSCEIELSHLLAYFEDAPASVVESIKDSWATIKSYANQNGLHGTPWRLRYGVASSIKSPNYLHNRLKHAYEARDINQLETLWADAQRLPVFKSVTGDTKAETRTPPAHLGYPLYNSFILYFMGLRQPGRAIAVWNHMVENDITPGLESWDSMLNGCKLARDPKALEDVWAKMLSSGAKPDATCWTSRISALINCSKYDAAIHALDQMGRQWLTAVKKKNGNVRIEKLQELKETPEAVKPTIATINAAVSGLLTHHQPEAAHRILSWAGNLGISPDVQTYNLLLRPLVRDGHIEKATALLKSMASQGIEADEVTFVTMLDDTFRHVNTQSPDELKELISNVFTVMEDGGLKIVAQTYTKIIYKLLQASPDNITLVTMVVQHMINQNIQPGPHIYTILIRHYFDLQPPNIDAIRSTIERARLEIGSSDHIFWDRVIEGYAKIGDTTTAIRELGKVQRGKQYTSWNTLRTLLVALFQNEEWDTAQELVRNAIKDTGGPIGEDVHGAEGQHRFWELARELGLI